MATAAIASQPITNSTDDAENTDPAATTSTWSAPETTLHPRAADIIRQIDYYFSDENLRQDAHLLGLFKEGKGSVSANEVLGFKKMRQFKPRSAVMEVIKQSNVVEVVKESNKYRLRRRQPLAKAFTVIPKISADRQKLVVPEDKPWLSKGMLRSTGFERYATDGPINPKEYEEDRNEYDPENSITDRLETAIRKFTARRKMHQETRKIFDKFMTFGGFDCGQSQFTGGVDDRTMEDMTKKEVAELMTYYGVSERVLDGLDDDVEGTEPTYIVDFETLAKGFFSSHFVNSFNWHEEKQVITATMVLRNFYNYLLLHDVCKEYNDQIIAARSICDLAEQELLKLSTIDNNLPGGFNVACSTLFEGHYANLHAAEGEWVKEDDHIGWSYKEARSVFLAGMFAHCAEEQLQRVQTANLDEKSPKEVFKVVAEEKLGLEVIGVQLAEGEAKGLYENEKLANTHVASMGKLRCKRWEVPFAKPKDVPASVQDMWKDEELEFLVEDETLKFCYPGIKIEACVWELDLGIKFIDYFEAVYASFFTWLPNEYIRDWKEPGPPKEWMKRQQEDYEGTIAVREDVAKDGDLEDDEMPD